MGVGTHSAGGVWEDSDESQNDNSLQEHNSANNTEERQISGEKVGGTTLVPFLGDQLKLKTHKSWSDNNMQWLSQTVCNHPSQ